MTEQQPEIARQGWLARRPLVRGLARIAGHERQTRARVGDGIQGLAEAFRGIAAVEGERLLAAGGARATELWQVPPAQLPQCIRRLAVEAWGLAAVAAFSVWAAAAAIRFGGVGLLNGAAALFFAVVVGARALSAWWRIDCLRADRVVGFGRWLRQGLRVEA